MAQDSISHLRRCVDLQGGAGEGGCGGPQEGRRSDPRDGHGTGPGALLSPVDALKFDDNGRRVGAPLSIVQWQNGEPVTVGPGEFAIADPIWTKK